MLRRLSAFIFAITGLTQASSFYSISLDTAALAGHAAAPFYFAAQLTDGSWTGNGNNAVIMSSFDFGAGGGVAGFPFTVGMAFGDMGSSVVLTDASLTNYFYQAFQPGSRLSFQLEVTLNDEAGFPDGLALFILDSTLTPIPTTMGGPPDAWLLVDLYSTGAFVLQFDGDTSRSPAAGGPPIAFGSEVTEVPEPVAGLFAGLLALLAIPAARFRRRERGARGRRGRL